MGQKVNPLNFRLSLNKCWDSKTFIDHFNYSTILQQDLYIRQYIKGILNKFKMFYLRCIIKRLNAKTFIIIYYYRRPAFNHKNFINYKTFNNRLNRFNKLKKLNFKLIKNNLKPTEQFLAFNDLKKQKIQYIFSILQGKTFLNNTSNQIIEKMNDNQVIINKKLKKVFYYTKVLKNFNNFAININQYKLFLNELKEKNISKKYFFFLIWKNLIKIQKSLNVEIISKLNNILLYLNKKNLTLYLNEFFIKNTLEEKNYNLEKIKDLSSQNTFSLKKVIKMALSKILNSRKIHISFINVGKYNIFKLKKNKRNISRISKLNNMSRMLNFGFSQKFNILTINLFQKAFKYKNVDVLANFLAYLFKKNIRKPRVFFRFIDIVIGYFYTFYKLQGIQVAFKGRINGATRTRTIILKKGNLPLSTIDTNLLYSFSNIYTFYGVYGVKIWIYF